MQKNFRVIVLAPFGGRLDHVMQHLNILYKWSSKFYSLLLLSEDCHASLLPAGEAPAWFIYYLIRRTLCRKQRTTLLILGALSSK